MTNNSSFVGINNQYLANNCFSSSANGNQNQYLATGCYSSSANGNQNQCLANTCYQSSANGSGNQQLATNCFNSVAEGVNCLRQANGANNSVCLGSGAGRYSTSPGTLSIEGFENNSTNNNSLIGGSFVTRTLTFNGSVFINSNSFYSGFSTHTNPIILATNIIGNGIAYDSCDYRPTNLFRPWTGTKTNWIYWNNQGTMTKSATNVNTGGWVDVAQ